MKKVVTLLCILFLLGLGAQSMFAQIFTEDFNYTIGDSLKNDTAGHGGAGWLVHSGGNTNAPYIVDSNLTLVGTTTYPSGGHALYLRRSGEDINYRFTNDSIDASVGSGVLYASMLVNVTQATRGQYAAADYFFNFGDHGASAGAWTSTMSTNDFWAHVYVRKSLKADSALTFGLSRGALTSSPYAGPVFSDSIYSLETTYLLVVKYDFAAGDTSSASASLYVFKAGDDWTSEPAPTVGPLYGVANGGAPQFGSGLCGAQEISFVALRQGGGASSQQVTQLTVDGLHVSQDWQSLNLPVELTAFNAVVSGKSVELAWSTETEVNNSGFAVERKTSAS